MKKIISILITTLFLATPVFAGTVAKMSKDELKAQLGSENLVIIDVRTGRDWSTSEFKIKGAVRVDRGDFSILSKYPKNHTFVLYCA